MMLGLPLWFIGALALLLVGAILLGRWGIKAILEDRRIEAEPDLVAWRKEVTPHEPQYRIPVAHMNSPGRDWDSSRTPAPAAGGHHLGAPFERTITGDIWDQWWEGLDGLNRECLLVTAWVGRESAAWAELVAETKEMCAA